jgi:hypothetical protein
MKVLLINVALRHLQYIPLPSELKFELSLKVLLTSRIEVEDITATDSLKLLTKIEFSMVAGV